jgi:hypothetical protein
LGPGPDSREADIVEPRDHLVVSPAMDEDPHRVPAIVPGLQPRLITGVEAEQQRPTGAKYPPEMREDQAELVVGDVDQRLPGNQADHRGIGQGELRHGTEIEPETGVLSRAHR